MNQDPLNDVAHLRRRHEPDVTLDSVGAVGIELTLPGSEPDVFSFKAKAPVSRGLRGIVFWF